MNSVETIKSYYPNGRLKAEGTLKNGVPHGIHREWHENGTLATERTLKNGVPDGISRYWDENGKLLAENKIVNGTGVEQRWNPISKLKSEQSWVNGMLTGRYRVYWPDGSVAGEEYWIRNRKISKKKYMELCLMDDTMPKYKDCSPKRKQSQKSAGEKVDEPVYIDIADDAYYETLFTANKMTEVLSWLTEIGAPERTLGECARPQDSIELIKDLYVLGSVKVLTFDIEGAEDEEQNSGKIVIELPNDPRKREKILEKCSEINAAKGFDKDCEMGQKYVLVTLD